MATQKYLPSTVQVETLEECQAALQAATHEVNDLLDKYLRASAEIENTRKRVERESKVNTTEKLKGVFLRLLEVADSLERGLRYAAEDDSLASGLRATLSLLQEILRREGVERVEVSPGDRFDPNFQEAVEAREGDVNEMTVAEVIQPAYQYQGQLLRPARVVVNRPANAIS